MIRGEPGLAVIVVGLGFGDEGKGSVTDALVRRLGARTVVRFNGGPQAAHHVVLPDGRTHCFAQLGSGALVPGVRTLLSRFMVVDPPALEREARALRRLGGADAPERLDVDPRAVIVTPFHRALNRIAELARAPEGRHGTCGRGVGLAWTESLRGWSPTLRVGDLLDRPRARATLRLLQATMRDLAELVVDLRGRRAPLRAELGPLLSGGVVEALLDRYDAFARRSGLRLIEDEDALHAARHAPVIFEGAQGVLLDPRFGFPPHVTKTWTTSENARQLLAAGAGWRILRLGVLRVFPTRHGAGPFVTRDPALDPRLPERHNGDSPWQGPFLRGWPDAVALRYALEVERPDGLAITHLDALSAFETARICRAYEPLAADSSGLITALRLPRPGRSQPVELARTLGSCRPRYEAVAAADLLPRSLELAGAAAPVLLESRGPTWADKRW